MASISISITRNFPLVQSTAHTRRRLAALNIGNAPLCFGRIDLEARPGEDGQLYMYTKGAPDALLVRCTHERVAGEVRPLTDSRRHAIAVARRCATLDARPLALSAAHEAASSACLD